MKSLDAVILTRSEAIGKLRIISSSGQPFRDRQEAGRLLARELGEYRGQTAVVLGIPRGGIIVAREVASALEADLDIVLSRKLGSPGHEELAMGSVAEDGRVFLNEAVIQELAVTDAQIQREKQRQMAEIARRTALIRRVRQKIPLKGRVIIVADDGVATGATTQAALWSVRQEQPRKLVAAIPVGPEETIRKLAADVDEMVCLRAPPFFLAVGQFYQQFQPIEDEEMLDILRGEQKKASGR